MTLLLVSIFIPPLAGFLFEPVLIHRERRRLGIADIIVKSLQTLDQHYPKISAAGKQRFDKMRGILQKEKD